MNLIIARIGCVAIVTFLFSWGMVRSGVSGGDDIELISAAFFGCGLVMWLVDCLTKRWPLPIIFLAVGSLNLTLLEHFYGVPNVQGDIVYTSYVYTPAQCALIGFSIALTFALVVWALFFRHAER